MIALHRWDVTLLMVHRLSFIIIVAAWGTQWKDTFVGGSSVEQYQYTKSKQVSTQKSPIVCILTFVFSSSDDLLSRNSNDLPKKTDEQSALTRILQETAT